LATLRRRIAERAGDRRIDILAVTKGFGRDAVYAAVRAGCTMIGENYANELLAKVADVVPRPAIHFIGRLQSNKVRRLATTVDVWESVDRVSLLDEIARRRPGATVLIQVNSTGEEHKGGCPVAEVETIAAHARSLNLDLDGVMTVGPTDGDHLSTRRAFELTRKVADDLAVPTCSMGMTDDLDIALDAGTTRVRVGTALFGPRPSRAP
jgi:pyridoxal phosphate enzyme (YggS family)